MRLRRWVVLATLLCSQACYSFSNQYGDCIGVMDDRDPAVRYEVSATNLVWAIITVELIVPPFLWLLTSIKCPVGPSAADPNGVRL